MVRRLRIENSPFMLLLLMAVGMQFCFAGWNVLAKNFAVEELAFTGREVGIQEAVREIPGFLAFLVVYLTLFIREQRLAILSLAFLALGVFITGFFDSFAGFLFTTLVMSIGFHYYETCQQSLSLHWLPKETAPAQLGLIISAAAVSQLAAYSLVLLAGWAFAPSFKTLFAGAGIIGLAIVLFCAFRFSTFSQPVSQAKRIVIKRRYWLYYALVFMSGARRQIFIVFAALLMIERYGFNIKAIAALFLINGVVSMVLAPLIGKMIIKLGERMALIIEYVGLISVFALYGVVAAPEVFGFDPLPGIWTWWAIFGAVLYVLDHAFFAMAIAQKTYFQKIASPEDMAPTAAFAFTVNHIASVTLPVAFGFLWLVSPSAVFLSAAAMAFISLILSLKVPRHPQPGHETRPIFRSDPSLSGAPAE